MYVHCQILHPTAKSHHLHVNNPIPSDLSPIHIRHSSKGNLIRIHHRLIATNPFNWAKRSRIPNPPRHQFSVYMPIAYLQQEKNQHKNQLELSEIDTKTKKICAMHIAVFVTYTICKYIRVLLCIIRARLRNDHIYQKHKNIPNSLITQPGRLGGR